jgi:hypothetical protein
MNTRTTTLPCSPRRLLTGGSAGPVVQVVGVAVWAAQCVEEPRAGRRRGGGRHRCRDAAARVAEGWSRLSRHGALVRQTTPQAAWVGVAAAWAGACAAPAARRAWVWAVAAGGRWRLHFGFRGFDEMRQHVHRHHHFHRTTKQPALQGIQTTRMQGHHRHGKCGVSGQVALGGHRWQVTGQQWRQGRGGKHETNCGKAIVGTVGCADTGEE